MAVFPPGTFRDIRDALRDGAKPPGGAPPTVGMPGDFGPSGGDYLIRSQGDFDALLKSIITDVEGVKWEGWLQGEQRRIEAFHDTAFKQGGAGYFTAGGGWAPNAQSTVRKKGHARPLFGVPAQGFRLHKSLTQPKSEFGIRYEIDEWPRLAQLVFGTDAPYHKYNQYGTSRIPARPHVGVSHEHFDGIVQRAVDQVFEAIQQ